MGYWESIGCTISNPAAIVESYFKYKSIEITHNILDYSLSTYLEYLHSSGYFALLNAISPANILSFTALSWFELIPRNLLISRKTSSLQNEIPTVWQNQVLLYQIQIRLLLFHRRLHNLRLDILLTLLPYYLRVTHHVMRQMIHHRFTLLPVVLLVLANNQQVFSSPTMIAL